MVGDFNDDYDDTVEFLKSKGYKIHMSNPHTPEELAFEVYFIKEDFDFPGKDIKIVQKFRSQEEDKDKHKKEEL